MPQLLGERRGGALPAQRLHDLPDLRDRVLDALHGGRDRGADPGVRRGHPRRLQRVDHGLQLHPHSEQLLDREVVEIAGDAAALVVDLDAGPQRRTRRVSAIRPASASSRSRSAASNGAESTDRQHREQAQAVLGRIHHPQQGGAGSRIDHQGGDRPQGVHIGAVQGATGGGVLGDLRTEQLGRVGPVDHLHRPAVLRAIRTERSTGNCRSATLGALFHGRDLHQRPGVTPGGRAQVTDVATVAQWHGESLRFVSDFGRPSVCRMEHLQDPARPWAPTKHNSQPQDGGTRGPSPVDPGAACRSPEEGR